MVRATGDIDLLVRPTEDNSRRVFAALVAFGAPVAAHGVSSVDLERPERVYEIGLPPRRIGLLSGAPACSCAWGASTRGCSAATR